LSTFQRYLKTELYHRAFLRWLMTVSALAILQNMNDLACVDNRIIIVSSSRRHSQHQTIPKDGQRPVQRWVEHIALVLIAYSGYWILWIHRHKSFIVWAIWLVVYGVSTGQRRCKRTRVNCTSSLVAIAWRNSCKLVSMHAFIERYPTDNQSMVRYDSGSTTMASGQRLANVTTRMTNYLHLWSDLVRVTPCRMTSAGHWDPANHTASPLRSVPIRTWNRPQRRWDKS